MAHLYGKSYSRSELMAHVGDISQIARIKPYRLIEGREDGVLAADITTGSGLDFTVLPSRGMDISSASFCGRSMAWRSATTDTHPSYFDHEGENGRGWLRAFYGGLVVTCGLTWAGANGEENGQKFGLHGRISNLQAANVSWNGWWEADEYLLSISGKMREATVFGENLEMTRVITTQLGSKEFSIHDTVENMGYKTTEHMMLYHINIGFPAVNDTARLIAPTLKSTPRDSDAAAKESAYTKMQPPETGYRETVYFHDLAVNTAGKVTTAVVDDNTHSGEGNGFGVYCRYSPSELPKFIEWKMMDSGTYVLGMEPANCLVMGRPHDRNSGILQYLEPGVKREYHLDLGVLSNAAEISELDRITHQLINGHPA